MWKRIMLLVSITLMLGRVQAQTDEAAQLLLNVEKLSQLKNILSDLRKSYQILHDGYSAIKDISEGNFSIHKVFLDGLMQVSPAVKKYRKVAYIVEYQLALVREYKSAYRRFAQQGTFSVSELAYLAGVYENLVRLSLRNLDELITVTTAGQLRMSDEERLAAIDRIYSEMEDKVQFLRWFNGQGSVLSLQRARAKRELEDQGLIYGLK